MSEGIWHFKAIEPGTPERNPRETEFFKLTSPSEAIVREFIQNSLDAKTEGVVSIRFYLGSAEKEEMQEYFRGIEKHLEACQFSFPQSLSSISYLTIEDFGTTGLDGMFEPDAGNGNFYNFWWREGISQKKGQKAGRWGLGKTTFHLVSKIRTFWGLTVRAGGHEHEYLLMGKALLKTHKIDNKRYHYFGYFSDSNFKPLMDDSFIIGFKKIFNITRTIDSPGLSIVVPVLKEGINFDSILNAAIRHYFYPILDGTLQIKINDGNRNAIIDASNLVEKVGSMSWEQTEWEDMNITEILEFIKNTIDKPAHQIQITNPGDPKIAPESFGGQLNILQQSFRSGKPVKFQIPVHIIKGNGIEKDTFFTVLIKRFPELRKAFECYIRAGIRVTEIKELGNRPVVALLIVEDQPLSEFLGNCETPAHTKWNERTEDFKKKYRNGVRILRFIKKSLYRIVSILDEPPQERQVDFLKEIFSILATPEEREEKQKKEEVTPPFSIPPPQEPLFDISQISGGFTVILNPKKTNVQFPFHAILKVAYDTRRGNPFSQYELFDFDLGERPITLGSRDCNIQRRERNALEIEVRGQNFRLEVRGFDENRDLVVDIKET